MENLVTLRRLKCEMRADVHGKGSGRQRSGILDLVRGVCQFFNTWVHFRVIWVPKPPMGFAGVVYRVISLCQPFGNMSMMLISGFCGITSSRLNFQRLFVLWLQVMFYRKCGEIAIMNTSARFLIRDMFFGFFPFYRFLLDGAYWYVTVYFQLALLTPVLNAIGQNLTKLEFRVYIIAILMIFFFDCRVAHVEHRFWGVSSPLFMSGMYMIGGFLRYHQESLPVFFTLGLFVLSFCVRYYLSLGPWKFMFQNKFRQFRCALGPPLAHSSDSFLAPLMMISGLAGIIRVRLGKSLSDISLFLGEHSLSVFLIHNFPIYGVYITGALHRFSSKYVNASAEVIVWNMILFDVNTYLICFFIDLFREFLFKIVFLISGNVVDIVKVFENIKKFGYARSIRRGVFGRKRIGYFF